MEPAVLITGSLMIVFSIVLMVVGLVIKNYRIKRLAFVALCVLIAALPFVGKYDDARANDLVTYPKSYLLTEQEVPEGFILYPLESGDNFFSGTGMTQNPGEITNREIYKYVIYGSIDPDKINRIFLSFYVKADTFNKDAVHKDFDEIIFFVVNFNSEANLDSEIPKIIFMQSTIKGSKTAIFLRNKKTLVIAITSSKEFIATLNKAVKSLRTRLALKEINGNATTEN